MAFEKINADDTLNQGRIKINNNVEAVIGQVSELKEDKIDIKNYILENVQIDELTQRITANIKNNGRKKYVAITNGSANAGYYTFNVYSDEGATYTLGKEVILQAGETKIFELPNKAYGNTLYIKNTNTRTNSYVSAYYKNNTKLIELANRYGMTVVVSKEDDGDFNTIEEAISYLKNFYDVMKFPTTIYVKRGVYTVTPTNNYPFSPLNKGANKISIIGEDMYGVIIKCTNTADAQSKVLNIGGECLIKNLSIYCLNDGTYNKENDKRHNPYCLHNDEDYTANNPYKTVVENVYLYSECAAPLGGGLRDKQEQIYKNVILNANGIVGAGFYVHGPSNPSAKGCSIIIDNVSAECHTGMRAIDLSPVPGCLDYTEIPVTITRSIFVTNGETTGAENFKKFHKLTNISALNNINDLNY